ncbi:MAG TPA: ABC transporter permease [Thermoanaerobaculia bacterium]|nr:ABC transporter permease [Thermoanaerobaculia bacterium]
MLQDIRFALRTLARQRFVTAMVVLCLALVVGVNTAVFSVFRSYILKPLPYPEVDRLALVVAQQRALSDDESALSQADFRDFAAETTVFETLGAVSVRTVNLTGDGPPEQLTAPLLTADALDILGARPIVGRAMTEDDSTPGAAKVVLLDHAFWQRRFEADPGVVGRTVLLDREPHEVIGVLPEGFEYVWWGADVWLPLTLDPAATDRSQRTLGHLLGRLRPGVTPDQARADVERVAAELETRHPETHRGYTALARTLPEWAPGPTDTRLFSIVQVAGLLVLLIACANIANLLLARGQVRRREVALRTALGAARTRVLRQLLTESVVLALLGGIAGVGLGAVGVRLMRGALVEATLPRFILPELDGWVLLFSLVISALAGVVFGVVPGLQAARSSVSEELKEGGSRGSMGGRRVAARGFVIAEIACATALLVGAGALFRTFFEIQYGDHGFRTSGLLTFGLSLPEDRYPDDEKRNAFREQLLPQLAAVPGVSSAASSTALPRSRAVPVAGVTVADVELGDERAREAAWLSVSPDYFETLGLPLLRGRAIEPSDRSGTTDVAVVDAAFADRFFEGDEALGERFEMLGRTRQIVGLVSNVKQRRISVLENADPTVYLPAAQAPSAAMQWVVRARSGDEESLTEGVRAAVWAIDPELPLDSMMSLDQFISVQLAGIDVLTSIIGGFASFAMLLAGLGVYGLLAYSVSQRTREIGLRMAMGASRRSVMGMVLRQGLMLAGAGLLFGVPMAWGVSRLLAAMLGPLGAPPPSLLPAIALGLVVVTMLASLLPARRAAMLPPLSALRVE